MAQAEPSQITLPEGWLQGRTARGRPVDLLQLPDGSLPLSDGRRGALYRRGSQVD